MYHHITVFWNGSITNTTAAPQSDSLNVKYVSAEFQVAQ